MMDLMEISQQLLSLAEAGRLHSARDGFDAVLRLGLPEPEQALLSMQYGIFSWVELVDGVQTRRLFQQAYELATSHSSDTINLSTVAADAAENLLLLSLSAE